jgi:murein L,D-transpeptidase YcbB/YkuD
MFFSLDHTYLFVPLLALGMAGGGCTPQTTPQPQTSGATEAGNQGSRQATSQPLGPGIDAAAVSARLHAIATAGKLADLRWPDFPDYKLHFQHVYDAVNFVPMWLRDGQPSLQALGMIQAFEGSQRKGLEPGDYDASTWQARITALKTSGSRADVVANFDAALTVDAMRYISDLHIGRVDPAHFKFGVDIAQNKYDLPHFVTTKVISAPDVAAVLAAVEPPYDGYRRTEAALEQYEQLNARGDGPKGCDGAENVGPRRCICGKRRAGCTVAAAG